MPGGLIIAILVIVMICFILYSKGSSQNNREISSETYMPEQISKPKIGAEVSVSFYNEVKDYCSKHSISISELIRSSVRTYMDMNTENGTRSQTESKQHSSVKVEIRKSTLSEIKPYKPPSPPSMEHDPFFWQCPECGKYHDLTVGKCDCGCEKP